MRRIMTLALMLMLIVSTGTVSYAASIDDGGELDLQYIGVTDHTETFLEGLNMKVNYSATIVPKNENALDKVVVTFKVIHYINGNTVHQETVTTYYDEYKDQFKAQGSGTVPTIGTYYLDVTYKCYKNGTLIETITGQSKLLSI